MENQLSTMNAAGLERLMKERKHFRQNHPFGFVARPSKNSDGTLNLLLWDCIIPGKEGTIWEGGSYKLKMRFPFSYPAIPPHCYFSPTIFHPNVYFSGNVCLSTLTSYGWNPATTVTQVLLGIQALLNHPNTQSPAQSEAADLFDNDRREYKKRVRSQAQLMSI